MRKNPGDRNCTRALCKQRVRWCFGVLQALWKHRRALVERMAKMNPMERLGKPEDTASCPAYAGPICSLCCSLDARCHDLCKPHARVQSQVAETLGKLLPQPIYARINSQLGHYLGVFAVSIVTVIVGIDQLRTQ